MLAVTLPGDIDWRLKRDIEMKSTPAFAGAGVLCNVDVGDYACGSVEDNSRQCGALDDYRSINSRKLAEESHCLASRCITLLSALMGRCHLL